MPSDDLPTIEYVGEDGTRHELDFQRVPQAPWRAMLVEADEDEGELRHAGTEVLRELRINGEPVTAISLADTLEGP